MIRISSGSAACMGLSANRMDAYPTTAYFLSGNSCLMNCSFCPQGSGNHQTFNRLGRINWPEFSWAEAEKGLRQAEGKGIRRVCLQSVRHTGGIAILTGLIKQVKDMTGLPLSVSAWIGDQEEAEALIEAGAERISISLDVVNPQIHDQIKGGSLKERLDLLLNCARRLPGKMSTHLICGLGESEKETLQLIDQLTKAEISTALFAFVPLKGTGLENFSPPPVDSYRRIQAGRFLLNEKLSDFKSFKFAKGRLVSFGISESQLEQHLSTGAAFQTSGCPDCNRPFYNERPGGIIYNYHRALNDYEKKAALKVLFDSIRK